MPRKPLYYDSENGKKEVLGTSGSFEQVPDAPATALPTETVATYSAMQTSITADPSTKRDFFVSADETNGGVSTKYSFNGSGIIPIVPPTIENPTGLLFFQKQLIAHLADPDNTSLGIASIGDSVSLQLLPAIVNTIKGKILWTGVQYPGLSYNSMAVPTYTGSYFDSSSATVDQTVLDGTGGKADFTYLPGGDHFVLHDAATFSATHGEQTGITKIKVLFARKPSGGTATVNIYNRDTAALLQSSSISLSNATIDATKIEFTVDQYTKHKVEIVAAGGDVVVLRIICGGEKGLMPFNFGRGTTTLAQNNYSNKTILNYIISDLKISLIALCCKEEYIDTSLTPFFTSLSNLTTVSKLIIGSAPDATASSSQISINTKFQTAARANGFAYFDAYRYFKDYTNLTSLGWNGDGTHPPQTAYDAFVRYLLNQITSFSPSVWRGNIDQKGTTGAKAILGNISLIPSAGSTEVDTIYTINTGSNVFKVALKNISAIYFGGNTDATTAYLGAYGSNGIAALGATTNEVDQLLAAGVINIIDKSATSGKTLFETKYGASLTRGWWLQNAGGPVSRQILRGVSGGVDTIQFDPNNGITAQSYKLSALNTAPASATATGTTGDIRVTSGFIYVCIATNTWVRAALTTW